METPESLTTCNETNVEKKLEEEKVSQDELNIKEEYNDALSCTGFEKDGWYKYNTIVNVVLFTFLILSFILIVGIAVHVGRIVYLIVQKKIFISKILNKEL
ncbi:uncharacterized protein LOC132937070 [Metopolophium dirhodum]|uniref:uncharacterized protein LOC132937070 n=1 Tax=Metopolophium dirhodum TaxID=44670 RepID=UPI00298F691F|nr:uncharacterized protein LOC132937070 [Metopolophium dirhodum]